MDTCENSSVKLHAKQLKNKQKSIKILAMCFVNMVCPWPNLSKGDQYPCGTPKQGTTAELSRTFKLLGLIFASIGKSYTATWMLLLKGALYQRLPLWQITLECIKVIIYRWHH